MDRSVSTTAGDRRAIAAAVAIVVVGGALCIASSSGVSFAASGLPVIAANLLCFGAIAVAIRVHRPALPLVWWLLALNAALLTIGFVMFHAPAWDGGPPSGAPSYPDIAWLLSYPALIAALSLAVARRLSLSFAMIDIAALWLAMLILIGSLLIGPYLSREDLALEMRLVQSAYAFFDVGVAVGALRLLASRHQSAASILLGVSSLAYVASDIGWNWQVLLGGYGEGAWMSSGWILAGALLGASAVVPSMRRFSDRPVRASHELTWHNAVMLAVSPMLAPIVLSLHHVVPGWSAPAAETVAVVVISSLLLAALAAVRVWLLISEGRELSGQLKEALSEQVQLLERSEELYQDLVEQLPGVVFIAASFGDQVSLVYVSPQVEPTLGVSREACLEDAFALIAPVHPDDRDVVVAHTAAQHAGHQQPPLEYRFVRPDGQVLWVREEATTKVDAATGTRYVQGILLDISARKGAEQERDALETDLRIAQRLEAVGQLAAGIAHEINTPIQYVGDTVTFLEDAFGDVDELISAYGTLYAGARNGGVKPEHLGAVAAAEDHADIGYLRERVPAAFGRARDGIERVSRIVGAMREFAHPPTVEMAAADLNAALQSTLTVARSEYKYVADVELDLGDLPPVTCNVGDLNQVFLNLIVNAAHAIEDVVVEGEWRGTITVSTRTEGDDAIIRIADTGAGIPADVADRVFDPFFTTKDVGRGTGQGLALAHRIVFERHGGELTFESEPGAGTAFEIRVPIAGATQSEEVAA